MQRIVKIQITRLKIPEASQELQVGGILFPKYRGKLFEDEDLKTTENRRFGPERETNAPKSFSMRLGHCLCAPWMDRELDYARHAKTRGAIVFSCFRNW